MESKVTKNEVFMNSDLILLKEPHTTDLVRLILWISRLAQKDIGKLESFDQVMIHYGFLPCQQGQWS